MPGPEIKAAHILRKYDPREWGGTETAISQLLDGLRSHGVESKVYCPWIAEQDNTDPLAAAGHPVVRFKAFVPVLGISAQQREQRIAVGGNLMSLDLIGDLLSEPNLSVLHMHTLGRLAGIGRFVARRRGIPLVITIHGGVLDLPEAAKEKLRAVSTGGWEWGKVFGFLLKARRALEDADAIITLNPREAALLREKYPEQRVLVMPHGIPCAIFEANHKEAAQTAFPQIRERRVLLCIGRIDPVKNQSWLVEQMPEIRRRYPEALLVFAGAATDREYAEALKQRAAQSGLAESIFFAGGLPPRDPRLIGLLQTAELVVVPSLSETFGLVLLEAWAAGTAVIASNTSGARQLIKPGENGWLFELSSPETFHQALSAALSNRDNAARTAEAGRRLVKAEYDNLAVTERVRGLYTELMEKKRK